METKKIKFKRGASGQKYLEYSLDNGISLRFKLNSVMKEDFDDYNSTIVLEEIEVK